MKLKRIKDWKLFSKLISLVLFAVIPFILIIVIYIMPATENNLLKEKEITLTDLVSTATGILENYEFKVQNNELTKDEAQKLALKEISKLRYADGDYFWINDLNCKMIMHPIKSELDGKDLSDFKDPEGNFLFRKIVEQGQKKNGGIVRYLWPKPGKDNPVQKLSYAKLFKKWNWIIATGFYIDDLNSQIADIKYKVFFGMIIALLIVLGGSYYCAHDFLKPIIKLKNAANELNAGNTDVHLSVDSEDETGELTKAFNTMTDKISMQLQYLENLPSPVMIIDKDFNIQYMNKKGAEIAEKPQKDLIGLKCFEQFKTRDCNTENCALREAMIKDGIVSRETIAKPNGREVPILYTGSPVKDRNGKVIGALESITDITDVKEIQNYLNRSTKKMMIAMQQFANGNLNVNIKPEKDDDDIGQLFKSFNKAVENLRNMLLNVTSAVNKTASAVSEISSSTEEMAAGSAEQTQQATEIATSVEEMTRTILETTKNANSAANAAKDAGNTAKNGGQVVKETVDGMHRIADAVESSSLIIQNLGNSSNQIGEIIQVIDDIAEQTNLLALNAAIEAARAGEQGRGFAVVADEVRKLADRTTKATKEIAEMIKTIQTDTTQAVSSMNQGTEEVKKGIELADKAGNSLNEIIEGSEKVVDIASQVAAASEEQSSASEQISTNIDSISNVTSQTADGIRQVAESVEALNNLTENLQDLIAQFKIDSEPNYLMIQNEENKIADFKEEFIHS